MSETDAFSVSFKSIDDPLGQKQWVPADLARRLERERDKARAVADELAAIATRYLAWHLSRTPMGPDDDHLAQSRKITEAIARWKSIASA